MDHKYQQLVLFPSAVIALETEREAQEAEGYSEHERFEVVTQQQLSRAVALILMVAFGVFLVGYVVGKYTHEKVYDNLIPSEMYGLFFAPKEQLLVREINGVEYARVATLQEAVTLSSKLTDSEIVTRTSCSVSGEEKQWYQVVLLKKGYPNDR